MKFESMELFFTYLRLSNCSHFNHSVLSSFGAVIVVINDALEDNETDEEQHADADGHIKRRAIILKLLQFFLFLL